MNITKVGNALRALADAIEEEGIQTKAEVPTKVEEVLETPPPPVEESPPEPTPVFSMTSQAKEITKDDIIAGFQSLAQKKGQKVANETVQRCLKQLGLTRATEGTPDQMATVYAAMQEALDG